MPKDGFTQKDREMLRSMHQRMEEVIVPSVNSHDTRIKKIEDRHLLTVGATSAISTFFGYIASHFGFK